MATPNKTLKMKQFVIIILIVSAVGLLIYRGIASRTIMGEYPIKKVTYHKYWVRFTPEEDVDIQDLVDMRLFHNFPANVDFNYALEHFGEPDNIREEDYNSYYEYSFDETRVEIASEEYSTGNDIAVSWATYSHPFDKLYTDVLPEDITRYIDPTNKNTSVVINDSDGEIVVLVMLSGNRVVEMIRYR